MALTIQHVEEALCLAHISALAGMARINFHISAVFDYGVDGDFRHLKEITRHDGTTRHVESGFNVDFQAKATTYWTKAGSDILYDMEAKSYNDIVSRDEAATSLILVLLCLPSDIKDWHSATDLETTLRHSCYWAIPKGPPTTNRYKQRIRVPTANLLTPDAINGILDDERTRRLG